MISRAKNNPVPPLSTRPHLSAPAHRTSPLVSNGGPRGRAHRTGTKLILGYYIVKLFIDIVVPVMFSIRMRGRSSGGSMMGPEYTCVFPAGACPDFAGADEQERRANAYKAMTDESTCQHAGGIHTPVHMPTTDHSRDNMETYFAMRTITIAIAGITAAVTLKLLLAGNDSYLKPFVRSLVVLVAFEALAEVFTVFMIDDSCSDTTVRAEFRCSPMGGGQSLDKSSDALSCEEQWQSHDFPMFCLGIAINSYFIWIVSSYERSLRGPGAEMAAMPPQGALADDGGGDPKV
jgi:hypothetical protein